jgi:hypothetical protein
MEEQPNRPVFVVGSPRSGTSILTWCLGHHPNFFPVPESSWMGDFSLNTAVAYQIGAARGEYSILSAMDIPNAEFFAAFGRTINGLIMCHREDLEQKREAKCIELQLDRSWLEATSAAAGPKRRWVDGTPEYSLHICGLRKLFPDALFVHVVRDALEVVRSMVNFHRATGIQLVRDVEEAYHYWTRTVKACLMAERAYGPAVVHRVHYADLIGNRESTVRSLLEFLQEPYSDRCLSALDIRINSSSVPPDFQISGATINAKIATEARLVSDEIEQSAQPAEPSSVAADAMEAAFRERVAAVANRGNANRSTARRAEELHNCAVGSDPATEAVASVTGTSVGMSSLQP